MSSPEPPAARRYQPLPGPEYRRRIVWANVAALAGLHAAAAYGVCRVHHAHVLTHLWAVALIGWTGLATTAGAHRLFTHRSYKAAPALRLLLLVGQTMVSENCLWTWVRDHRQHHKHSETNADPHNANRGFFFAHMGWLMVRKHPDVIAAGRGVDMSDMDADWMVATQRKYYFALWVPLGLVLPVGLPVLLWAETWPNAVLVAFFIRMTVTLHGTWLVNSWAHLYGTRPYDRTIGPVESSLVSLCSLGEGWHNYHHAFPWDYRASEFGQHLSVTTAVLDALAALGLVYDRKAASEETVRRRAQRTGDGSHPRYGSDGVPEHLAPEPEPRPELCGGD
ncbi:hypothetical protein ONE63_002757 [Megalurothrips usitatus]|uniref:Fatty acid desaturase domain-containing protein n=1 Tax=Megalurothrips usitatus TaxID=439358 RepID=A0AAV7XBS3_9NEOP|nr:hypothetical protein ONE63_002757 [Megalurothrips usitatus]